MFLFSIGPSSSAERHDMAQKIQTILEDDIQGGEASQTVTFSYRGKDYEIDLNDRNADKMEKAFAFYIEHARRTGGRLAARRSSRKSDIDPAAVRAWAQSSGVTVSPRGRISAAVLEQYKAAGN